MSVRQMLASMDSRELTKWIALAKLERMEELQRKADADARRHVEQVRARRR